MSMAIGSTHSRLVAWLGATLVLPACSDGSGGRDPGVTTLPSSTSDASTGPASGSESGSTAGDTSPPPDGTTLDPNTGTTSATTLPPDDSTTGEPEGGEPFMMSDPLTGGTMGTALGGSFGDNGWTTTDRADRIYWSLPRLREGSFELTVTGLTVELMPLNDHEIFAMYEGGWGIAHPIAYNPWFRTNNYKSMIRVYGQAEVGRTGQIKLMWGMCPAGDPGYNEGACTCGASFFEEPFGGDPAWDGSPQRIRVEWDDMGSRLYRNGGLVLDIDSSAAGTFFGPQALYASLGTPRPLDVDTASMPVGITFSDVVVEGITGPEATCG